MSSYKEKVDRKIEESHNHIKPYLNDSNLCGELHDMCRNCERWCGKEHDYSECENMKCFKFYLAYEYMLWAESWS